MNPPMPQGFSPEVADFISRLLVKNPRKRLGGGEEDAEELKRHPFFAVSRESYTSNKRFLIIKIKDVYRLILTKIFPFLQFSFFLFFSE